MEKVSSEHLNDFPKRLDKGRRHLASRKQPRTRREKCDNIIAKTRCILRDCSKVCRPIAKWNAGG